MWDRNEIRQDDDEVETLGLKGMFAVDDSTVRVVDQALTVKLLDVGSSDEVKTVNEQAVAGDVGGGLGGGYPSQDGTVWVFPSYSNRYTLRKADGSTQEISAEMDTAMIFAPTFDGGRQAVMGGDGSAGCVAVVNPG